VLFLHRNGVGTSRAVRIYNTYGADAVQLISENPYRLARDIRGIGFRTADQIAGRLGIEKTALIRVGAGISFALAEAMDDGHCGLPQEKLSALTRELLEVSAALVETALGLVFAFPDELGAKLRERMRVSRPVGFAVSIHEARNP
jgi:exodeoxyribonuclease V alpha subunit